MIGEIEGVPFWSTSSESEMMIKFNLWKRIRHERFSMYQEPVLATALEKNGKTRYEVWTKMTWTIRLTLWLMRKGLVK